jgi:hypothetical protein
VSGRVRLIGYRTWQRDLRAQGWRDLPFWAALGVVWVASVVAGGMWPLLVVPVVLALDYGVTCWRISRRPDPSEARGR